MVEGLLGWRVPSPWTVLRPKQANRSVAQLFKESSFRGSATTCVGVLSPTLTDLLEEDLGVPFPSHLGRTKITGYVLHTPGEEIELSDEIPSIALRRVHFDAYMSAVAKKREVDVME